MRFWLLCVLLVVSTPVSAQGWKEGTPLKLPVEARPVAARISDYTLVSLASVRVYQAWHDADRKGALLEAGCEAGLTMGAIELLKHAVHRERPDGSDRHSFPSGHTGFAEAMGGWQAAVPVAAMRQMAWKHYLTDTVGGFVMGLVARKVCR